MKKQRSRLISDINVTSLVDVTFVLLIIFIIAAPFLRSGIKVDLPQAATREPQPHRTIMITVDREGGIFVNDERVAAAAVGIKVKSLLAESPDQPVLIEGDQKTPYGNVVTVMDQVRQAGIDNVGLVLESLPKP